ncbi:hypothetical protein VKT23_009746 [Stygiomarasmius scandens]|uniref:Uncharacterized protein n=1 Tax=Marasmiellus scandens TaxID=2682957 RepID=A0ABR1JIH9_9AGAR
MPSDLSPSLPKSVAPAALAGLIAEAVLFGCVILLTIASQYVLLFRPGASKNIIFVIASIVLFALATAHFVIDCVYLFQAFAILDEAQRLAKIATTTNKLDMARVAIYDFATVVGDIVVTYRAWIVWGKSWVLIIPSILLSTASTSKQILLFYCGE